MSVLKIKKTTTKNKGMTSAISLLLSIWKISHSYPGCSFVWKIRVVYFSVKRSYLCNKLCKVTQRPGCGILCSGHNQCAGASDVKGISPHKAAGMDNISARFSLRIAMPFRNVKYCKDNQLIVFYWKISCSLENCQGDTSV